MPELKLVFSTQITPTAEALEAINTFIQLKEANANAVSLGNASHIPQEEDFIRVPFRLLSAHIVGSETWKSTDFGDEAVLKASMVMLEGVPAYINHGTSNVMNAIGVIEGVEWQEAYVNELGEAVPAGIIANYKIDAVLNFAVARGLLSNPPSIQGSSVGIKYEYVPSHVFPEDWMFRNYIGDMVDGREVTRKVTKILEYYESSLVAVPADKFAKIIKASAKNKVSRDMSLEDAGLLSKEKMRYDGVENVKDAVYEVFEAQFVKAIDTTKMPTPQQEPTVPAIEKVTGLGDALNSAGLGASLELAELQGLQAEVTTLKGQFEAELAKAGVLQTKANTLKSELATLSEAKAQLEAEKTSLKAQAESNMHLANFGKLVLEERRSEVLRLYTLANDAPNDSVLALINSATPENIEGLMATFGAKAVDKFGGACQKCGSDKVTFRKSVPEDTNAGKPTTKPTTKGNDNDIRNALQ